MGCLPSGPMAWLPCLLLTARSVPLDPLRVPCPHPSCPCIYSSLSLACLPRPLLVNSSSLRSQHQCPLFREAFPDASVSVCLCLFSLGAQALFLYYVLSCNHICVLLGLVSDFPHWPRSSARAGLCWLCCHRIHSTQHSAWHMKSNRAQQQGPQALAPDSLGRNPSSAPYMLCNLGQIPGPLCSSLSLSIK